MAETAVATNAAANGGKVLKIGELTPDMVRLDGGMQHDQHM